MICVMVNGMPGKMAMEVANAILKDERMELVGYSLTGEEITEEKIIVGDSEIILVKPSEREEYISLFETFSRPGIIILDFTAPSAVNDNVKLYTKYGWNFIVGTTGGDREMMERDVSSSSSIAVIAPNMSIPIVVMQAMWQYAAENFPGSLKNFSFSGWESHQLGKKDKSGTMKWFLPIFRTLGITADEKNIECIREPEDQLSAGVPEEFLGSHGWHDYSFVSPNDQMEIRMGHDVSGKQTYICGVFEAINFVLEKSTEDIKGKVFSMLDVIKNQ